MLQRIKAIILALFVCVGVMAQSYRTVQVGGLGFNVSNDYEMELEEDDGFYIATLTGGDDDDPYAIILMVGRFDEQLPQDKVKEIAEMVRVNYADDGIILNPFSAYSTKAFNGLRTEGKMVGEDATTDVAVTAFGYGNCYVQSLEYYGKDYSSILTSVHSSNLQGIVNNGYCFVYDADRITAETQEGNGITHFNFTPAHEEDDFSLTYSFTNIHVDDLETFATEWFENMDATVRTNFSEYYVNPMEKTTCLGQPGYMKAGVVKLLGGDVVAKYVLGVCCYKGNFVFSIMLLPLDENLQPDDEVVKMFMDIDASMAYITE